MAGNPSLLHIQDCLSMGVVNGDILMDLISQSYNHQEKDVNKQVLFCRHLVQQQSMYPLYPASLMSHEFEDLHGVVFLISRSSQQIR